MPPPEPTVPPTEPQPEPAAPDSHSQVFAAQFQPPAMVSPTVADPASPPPVSSAPATGGSTAGGNQLPSAFSLFKPSWAAVRLNFGTLFLLALSYAIPILVFIIFAVATGISSRASGNAGATSVSGIGTTLFFLIACFIGFLIAFLLSPALAYTQLKGAQQQKVSYTQALKSGLHFFWRFIGISLVVAGVVIIGLVLFIVPGLLMLRRYYLAPYVMIDQDLPIFDAMKISAAQSKGRAMAVFGVLGVSILISVPQVIPVVGWVAATILGIAYSCAPAVRYIQLRGLSRPITPVTGVGPVAPAAPAAAPPATPLV